MLRGDYVIIKISGNKIKDENQKNIDNNYYNGRKFGNFSLNIPLKIEGFTIKKEETNIKKKRWNLYINFPIRRNKNKRSIFTEKIINF